MLALAENRLFQALRAAVADCSGSIAPLMALIAVPVLGLALTALDYNRAEGKRANMQAATDAAAAAAAKELGSPGVDVSDIVRGYLEADLKSRVGDHSYTLTIAPDNSALTIRMAQRVPTTLLSFAGVKTLEIVAESRAEKPKAVELAVPEADPKVSAEAEKLLGQGRQPAAAEMREAEAQARAIIQELERSGELPPEIRDMFRQLR